MGGGGGGGGGAPEELSARPHLRAIPALSKRKANGGDELSRTSIDEPLLDSLSRGLGADVWRSGYFITSLDSMLSLLSVINSDTKSTSNLIMKHQILIFLDRFDHRPLDYQTNGAEKY